MLSNYFYSLSNLRFRLLSLEYRTKREGLFVGNHDVFLSGP